MAVHALTWVINGTPFTLVSHSYHQEKRGAHRRTPINPMHGYIDVVDQKY